MSILLLNQFFWPDTAATGQLLSDLADHLSANGENVQVVCGTAAYGGTTHAPKPSVEIIRMPNSVGGRVGSYLVFLVGALWQGMRMKAPDIVVTLTTPPLLSWVGLILQKFRGTRHIIWEMDVYPDVAIDLGVLKPDSAFARLFGWLADIPRRHAERIIVLGECMRDRLLAHGLPSEKIVIAENWAIHRGVGGDPQGNGVEPFPGDPLTVVYSGNFGRAHDAETIGQAIVSLRSNADDVDFVFAGGGSRQAWLKDYFLAHGVDGVQFPPYCDLDELDGRLRAAHIGLVTQRNECLGSSVPSKAYGILAAGRPILYIGPKASTTARLIERHGCGWQVDCGDSARAVEILRHLSDNRQLIVEAGRSARRAFVTHYQRSVGVARIGSIISYGALGHGALERNAAVDAEAATATRQSTGKPGVFVP